MSPMTEVSSFYKQLGTEMKESFFYRSSPLLEQSLMEERTYVNQTTVCDMFMFIRYMFVHYR